MVSLPNVANGIPGQAERSGGAIPANELKIISMRSFPRGIAPDLLVSQVRSTMPYLFESEWGEDLGAHFPPAGHLREFALNLADGGGVELDHFEYFRLCLSAHYLTCGTPVPTDVDNQIRLKLWPKRLPIPVAIAMAELVLESRKWEFSRVSTRFVSGAKESPFAKEMLGGHHGEWFTVACAAYAALGGYANPAVVELRTSLFDAIGAEVAREAEVFGSLWRAHDGLGCLQASASIAHNLGDLDRVMDMWELSVGDPLRLSFYKLGSSPFDADRKLRYQGRLWVAGELYKEKIDGGSSLALENHRHFALRKPRSLRRFPELVVPTAPFFDAWGATIAKRLRGPDGEITDELREIVETLVDGWERQPGTVAYGRALVGIAAEIPELRVTSEDKAQQGVLETTREEFEARWASVANERVDDIPSRAS